MALRLAIRRSAVICNGIARASVHEQVLSRRNASAMAVPTESQPERTKNDFSVPQHLTQAQFQKVN